MTRVLRGERFPRSAYVRRVDEMLRGLNWWASLYTRRGQAAVTPVTRARLLRRASDVDRIWHELLEAQLQLRDMR